MHEQPWWMRTPIIGGAIILVLAVLLGSVAFLTLGDGDDEAQGRNPQSPESSQSTSTESSSLCDLPDGPMDVPSAAPESASWVIAENGVSTPKVPDFGPGLTAKGGYKYCFARNPLGAVLSAMWFAVDTEIAELDRSTFALDRVAGLEGQTRFALSPPSVAPSGVEFRGFRFPSQPSRDQATVELLLYSPTANELRSLVVDLVWDTKDWRLVFPDSPLEVSRRRDAEGFVAWHDPADPTAQPLGRAAPGWSKQAQQVGEDDATPDPPYTAQEQKWADGLTSESGSRAFAAMSHSERESEMTPDPPLSKSEKEWLKHPSKTLLSIYGDDRGKLTSNFLGGFYGLTHAGRGSVMKSLGTNSGGTVDQTASACSNLDVLACASLAKEKSADAVSEAAGNLADSAFGRIAQAAVDAAEWSMKTVLTAWLKYPEPEIAQCYGGSASCNSDTISAWIQSHLHWLAVYCMIGAIMIGAIRMALTGRGEHARDLGGAIMKMIVVTFGGGTIIWTSLQVADLYSDWILGQVELDFSGIVLFSGVANPFLLLVFGLFVVLVQLFQLGLMVVRTGMVLILAGTLPIAASMSNTAPGKQWLNKTIAWLGAWILYKPTAATIYAVAIKMTNGDQDITTQLSGVAMMVLGLIALPALMRLVMPLTAAASGGNAGAAAAGVLAGAAATGAVLATGGAAAAGGGFSGATAATRSMGGGGSGGASGSGTGSSPTGSVDPSSGGGSGPGGASRPDVVDGGGGGGGGATGATRAEGPASGGDSPAGVGTDPARPADSSMPQASGSPTSAASPPSTTAAGPPAPISGAGSGAAPAAAAPPTGPGATAPPAARGGAPASTGYVAGQGASRAADGASGAIESERQA